MSDVNKYRVPDVLDIIYSDIVGGLYFPVNYGSVNKRILISKCNIACDLLINSKLTEENIINHLSFPNLNDFREVFKDFLGITPNEFRRRYSL